MKCELGIDRNRVTQLMSGADETNPRQQLPERVLALPVYLILELTREGYHHAVGSKLNCECHTMSCLPYWKMLAV